jgi:hypothetical protein
MKQENVAKVVLVLVFLALVIQLIFIVSHAVGKDKLIIKQSKAVLGISF